MRLALGIALKFYTSVAKGLKLKVRKICGLIFAFEEVRGEKMVGVFLPPPPILNGVKEERYACQAMGYILPILKLDMESLENLRQLEFQNF